jgi:hypothetical protein
MSQTLTINFHGICVHFKDVVPGVAHRVVLPDAMPVRFGVVSSLLTASGEPAKSSYYLLPHYAFFRTKPVSEIKGRQLAMVLMGSHLRLVNASAGQYMQYSASSFETYALRTFAPRMTYSQDVVHGGRAACYFDLCGGTVFSRQTEGGARYTSIEIETDGPPQIEITPFPGSATSPDKRPVVHTLDTDTFTVGNVDFDSGPEDSAFDFLLNYLVARDGIPEILSRPAPGMPDGPQELSPKRLADALTRLADRICPGACLSTEEIMHIDPDVLTASCSDSNYP